MVFADDVVLALLAVGRQAAVGEVVAGHALVADDPSAFENREGKRGSLPMLTSLEGTPVAGLTELLYANST